MAFYFSSANKAFYDTDVFPVASLPANKVEITEAVYSELLTKQNQGYVILADGSGNPYAVAQGEATATDIKHAGTIATAVALGHVKIGSTMKTDAQGALDVKEGAIAGTQIADGSITTPKLADGAVTTAKIENGAVTEEKLDAVKDLVADETSLTMAENANDFTLSVKDGGISRTKIENAAINAAKIDEYAVTSEKIAPNAVIASKIADDAVVTSKIRNANVTAEKIADGAISLQKIDPDYRASILSFLDANDNNINGADWIHTFLSQDEKPNIGHIPNERKGRLCDFTFEAEFYIPQDDITTDLEFNILVWCRQGEVQYTYDTRTVKVTPGCHFVRERFSFLTDRPTNIMINFATVSPLSRAGLKNMQLRGFGAF